MDLFLVHSLFLIWASVGAGRRLTTGVAEQLLCAALMAWGNLVASGLVLAAVHRLGSPGWFSLMSLLLAGLTGLLVARNPAGSLDENPSPGAPAAKANLWLQAGFVMTFVPVFCANLWVAYTYEPNNHDALTYQIPRVLYYLGEGNLAHFDAADIRQICLPFNHSLLQLLAVIYDPPLQCLNFFNVAAWAVGGIAVYRLCRLCTCSSNASLLACWFVLMASPVLAQAVTTTPDLPVGFALAASAVFGFRWSQTGRTRYAMLAALGFGLAAGSDLATLAGAMIAGLLWLVLRSRSRDTWPSLPRRPWILAGLLAGFLSLPFVLLNLAAKGPGTYSVVVFLFHSAPLRETHGILAQFFPLLSKTAPLLTLNEDTMVFGPVALLFVAGAVLGVVGRRELRVFAFLGLYWILVFLILHGGAWSRPRDFIPALLLLSPGIATVFEFIAARRILPRFLLGLLVLGAALTTGWSSAVYLLKNTSRPLSPLLSAGFLPPALPTLPLAFNYHLAKQSRINVDTDSTDEPILPFLVLGRGQQITSWRDRVPEAYNLLSRSRLATKPSYKELSQHPIYIQIAIESKQTAGVEFLESFGSGLQARDYFGLLPNAGSLPPQPNNRTVLVTLEVGSPGKNTTAPLRIRMTGLNPADQARLVVTLISDHGSKVPLTTLAADGVAIAPIKQPFTWVVFTVCDLASGNEIGSTAIPFAPLAGTQPLPQDPRQPSGVDTLFVDDVVLSPDLHGISIEGLLPVEGPFPQWDLPFLRWARQPSVRITLPANALLARVQLSFSVRLHVRNRAALDVLWNGNVVEHYVLEDRTAWKDATLTLAPRPGANVLEFRDASVKDEPDWLDYLDRYPDVMKVLVANHIPLQVGARDHYETHGRVEGRTVRFVGKPEPAPDSYYFMFRNIRLEGFKSP